MIEKLKYLLAGFLVAAVAGCLVACDDDEPAADEWTADYVYLERPELGVASREFNLTHSSLGVAGDTEISLPLAIRLAKPWKSDVRVAFSCKVEGGDMPDGTIVFREGGVVVIPAGSQVARDTLDLRTDWTFVPREAVAYKITVGIGSVKPVSGQLRISSKQKELTVQINKAKSIDIQAGVKPAGSRITDYTGWSVYATSVDDNNAEWGDHQPKLINGDTGDYTWFNTPHLGIKIDMGAVKTVTGLETYSAYGSGYAMSSCSIYSSDDGAAWTLVTPEEGLAMTPSGTQYVSFIAPVTARYLIWHMYGSAPLSSEIFVYSK